MFSWIYICLQIHQVVHIKYVYIFVFGDHTSIKWFLKSLETVGSLFLQIYSPLPWALKFTSIRPHKVVLLLIDALFLIFWGFTFSVLFWIVSFVVTSSSVVFSSTISNLLFTSSSVFVPSDNSFYLQIIYIHVCVHAYIPYLLLTGLFFPLVIFNIWNTIIINVSLFFC